MKRIIPLIFILLIISTAIAQSNIQPTGQTVITQEDIGQPQQNQEPACPEVLPWQLSTIGLILITFGVLFLVFFAGQELWTLLAVKIGRRFGWVQYHLYRKNGNVKRGIGPLNDLFKWGKKATDDRTHINQATIHYDETTRMPIYILVEGTVTNINLTDEMKEHLIKIKTGQKLKLKKKLTDEEGKVTEIEEETDIDTLALGLNMNQLFPPTELGKMTNEVQELQYIYGFKMGMAGKDKGASIILLILIGLAIVVAAAAAFMAWQNNELLMQFAQTAQPFIDYAAQQGLPGGG